MDTIFHVYNIDLKTKVYLLYYWRAAKDWKVFNFIQAPTKTGVGDVTGNFLHVRNFDSNNFDWGGKSILTSITLELWDTIENDIRYDASRPEVFCAIIHRHEHVNCYVVCDLFQSLQKKGSGTNPYKTLKLQQQDA